MYRQGWKRAKKGFCSGKQVLCNGLDLFQGLLFNICCISTKYENRFEFQASLGLVLTPDHVGFADTGHTISLTIPILVLSFFVCKG